MIFPDTSFLFALISSRDEHHQRVREVFETIRTDGSIGHLITTNHVMAEIVTLVRRVGHQSYSFVDCLSFVVMDQLGIREALAVDSDFTHPLHRPARTEAGVEQEDVRHLKGTDRP